MASTKNNSSQEIKQSILNAATERFAQYGYNKTTMAEIASDCHMSAANIYRFFENKVQIGASLACSCLDEKSSILQAIVSDSKKTAKQRLSDYVAGSLNYTYSQWSETPKMNELVVAICNEHMDIVDQHNHKKQALLVTLLREGVTNGEFAECDLQITADAILTALKLFEVPLFMPMYSLETFERKAKNLVDLLMKGLQKR